MMFRLCCIVFSVAAAFPVRADDFADWQANREKRFLELKARNAGQDAVIADIKAKTAAMIAAHAATPTAAPDQPPVIWRNGNWLGKPADRQQTSGSFPQTA